MILNNLTADIFELKMHSVYMKIGCEIERINWDGRKAYDTLSANDPEICFDPDDLYVWSPVR